MSKESIIGIDLGTTNSSVAIIKESELSLLKIDGSKLMPSVVSIGNDNALLVGRQAVNNQLVNPENTVTLVKRQMGKETLYQLAEKEYTPQMISSLILGRLKQAAEQHTGTPIRKAVITVPAYFNEEQRLATQQAGELAGLEVLRLLNEPTAAALAYARNRDKLGKYLIYDFGGGTFDVSVVHITKDIMEVCASHGDTHLGGADIDNMLYKRVNEHFQNENGIDLSTIPSAEARAKQAVEAAKIKLSTEPKAEIIEECICSIKGKAYHLHYTITRTELENMVRPLIERTLISVEKAMEEGLCSSAKDLDQVILVGGSTYIPLVGQILKDRIGITPQAWLDPKTVVAHGAALEAAQLQGVNLSPTMLDITPHSLGVTCQKDHQTKMNSILIPKGSPLPVTSSRVFFKITDSVDRLEFPINQGESNDPDQNHRLGTFWLEDIPESDSREVLVKFHLDRSALLHVTVTDMGSGSQLVKKLHRSQKSCHKTTNLADLHQLITQKVETECEILNDEKEDKITVLLDPEIEKQATTLLEGEIDSSDKAELEDLLDKARTGSKEATKQLEELLYFLV